MADELPLVYEVGHDEKHDVPTITIRRKPSQIPGHLAMTLLRLAGHAVMDRPNSVETYIFLLPERFPEAENYLKAYKWERVDGTH